MGKNGSSNLTKGAFNHWKKSSFDPHLRKLERTEEHVLCLKKQVKEIRSFLMPPAQDSLEVQADAKANHTSPLVDVIRSTVRGDMWKVAGVIISAITVASGLVAWGVENRLFIRLLNFLTQ